MAKDLLMEIVEVAMDGVADNRLHSLYERVKQETLRLWQARGSKYLLPTDEQITAAIETFLSNSKYKIQKYYCFEEVGSKK